MTQPRRIGWPVVLLAVAAPLAVAGVGLALERAESREQVERLERVPFEVVAWDPRSCAPVAARERVIISHLDLQGATIFRTGPVPVAHGRPGQLLDAADGELPPWLQRAELQAALAGNRTFGRHWAGSVLVQTLASPRPEGGALYILTGSEMRFRRPLLGLQVAIGELFLLGVALTLGFRIRLRAGATP